MKKFPRHDFVFSFLWEISGIEITFGIFSSSFLVKKYQEYFFSLYEGKKLSKKFLRKTKQKFEEIFPKNNFFFFNLPLSQ